MELYKIKVLKRGGSFVGHHHFSDNHYLELGFHKDSDFNKIFDGQIVYAEKVSEMITVNGGRLPCSWSFFKVT